MTDYYLKFASEKEAKAIVEKYREYGSIDYIGTITKPTGELKTRITLMGEMQFYEEIALPGYHVNVRSIRGEIPELEPYALNPSTPSRTWL
jgi:hypothetical protein